MLNTGLSPNVAHHYHVGTLTYNRKTLAALFAWLIWGDICFVLMEAVVPSIMPLKLGKLGASNMTIGLIMTTLPMIINSVVNPVISFRSDRHRGRWGRRIPFILGTLPFLVLCLLGLGFSESITAHIGTWIPPLGRNFPHEQLAIGVVAVFMILFAFFNAFVSAVFWYLFNDVVPEHLLARLMTWFRTVSTGASAGYGFFIFGLAESHSEAIFLGAAALYTIGFGIMCLRVKEGKYPPPPANVDGKTGLVSSIKTYGQECYSYKHYNYLFLLNMALAGTWAIGPFGIFSYKAIGLTMDQIGYLGGTAAITSGVCILFSGWLADRYHPIRVVLLGLILQTFVGYPLSLIYIFWLPAPSVVFAISMITMICVSGPIMALMGILDPPLFMRIFPRSHYGQFCSANALLRSLSLLVNGVLAGVFLDVLTRLLGQPIWCAAFWAVTLVLLYRSWKLYGGDESYTPPMVAHQTTTFQSESAVADTKLVRS